MRGQQIAQPQGQTQAMTYHQAIPRKRLFLCLLAGILGAGMEPRLQAQNFSFIPPGPGVRLTSVSVNESYSLLPTPTATPVSTNTALPMDWDSHSGVAATVSWAKTLTHGNIGFYDSVGYGRRLRFSDSWDLYNDAHLTYSFSKTIKPRLTYSLGLDSQLMDFESHFLAPVGTTAATPVSTQPAGIQNPLNNGFLQLSAAQSALYGGRVFLTTVSNNLSFEKSPRLTYNFGLFFLRSQYLGGGNANLVNTQNVNSSRGLLGQSSNGSLNGGVNYQVSPRSSIGANLALSRSLSRLGDYYYTTAHFYVSRTVTEWWQVQAFAGAGFTGSTRTVFPTLGTPRPTGGFNTSFSGYSQIFSLAGAATIDDIYAIGSTRTLTATGSWQYHPPGSKWSLHAFGSESFNGIRGHGSLSVLTGSTGVSRVLTDHLFWALSGSYTNFRGLLLNNLAAASGSSFASAFNNQAYRGVQMSLTWTPAGLKW